MSTEFSREEKTIQKVLLLYPAKTVTAYFLDGNYPLQYLEKHYNISFVEKLPKEVSPEDIPEFDIIYCIRCLDGMTQKILKLAKILHKPFIYFTDDNFFICPEYCSISQKKEVESAIDFIRQVDALVVVSLNLLRTVAKYNKNVTYIRPYQIFIDHDAPNDPQHGVITIGHMSTINRHQHFDFLIPALQRILDEFALVHLEFLGFIPDELIGNQRVTHFNFIPDYLEFQKFFASRQWEIGLAPLKDSTFVRSKTDNKFREYGSHKICGIYSNVECYADSLKHLETGYLVENTPEAWYQAMKELIINEELRNNIANASYEHVKNHYNIETYCEELWNLFKNAWLNMPVLK